MIKINIIKIVNFINVFFFYKYKLAHLIGVPKREINFLYNEINTSDFLKEIKRKTKKIRGWYYLSMLSPFRAPLLYVICRILKPEVVIETGVADGYSSSFILYALEKNMKGYLYSIDLPNQPGHELKEGKTAGWLVPKNLKKRWTLIFGSSKEKLPELLINLNKIDIFYHDSDHSYEHMMFEFNTIWKYLKPKGYLLADDITENIAFKEFVEEKKCKYIKLFKLGIAIK